MKKFQLIFASVAILTAVAGVFANTLITTINWKRLSTATPCTGVVANPPGCFIPEDEPCVVEEIVEEELKTFHFDRETLNDQGQRIACDQYMKPQN